MEIILGTGHPAIAKELQDGYNVKNYVNTGGLRYGANRINGSRKCPQADRTGAPCGGR
jgi:hypothetical protein